MTKFIYEIIISVYCLIEFPHLLTALRVCVLPIRLHDNICIANGQHILKVRCKVTREWGGKPLTPLCHTHGLTLFKDHMQIAV